MEARDTDHFICIYVYHMLDNYSAVTHNNCCQGKLLIWKIPRSLYDIFATSPVSDFDCTWTWDVTAPLTLNLGAGLFWFHRYISAFHRSLT